jgi:septal ring factor EnvC (AmiA/AmiB activator)
MVPSMNEESTKNLKNTSFEERVFARFDAMDARLDAMDARLEKLESRSYDTKPIWERALKEIIETRFEIGEVKTNVRVIEDKVSALETEVASLTSKVSDIKTDLVEMRSEFTQKVVRRFDLFLRIREVDQEDFRKAEQRLALVESKLA